MRHEMRRHCMIDVGHNARFNQRQIGIPIPFSHDPLGLTVTLVALYQTQFRLAQ
ncbi:hypothetical protein X777_02586 [Ooceraea biroi]|uniref:Uncharacterized protein n=1 Tax=Ooceraea biroi TaxID=2015173 RepID=A0A026WMS8_OOCBI|nr:hypothetical protein X777_02586 [Ooceraea biroi]